MVSQVFVYAHSMVFAALEGVRTGTVLAHVRRMKLKGVEHGAVSGAYVKMQLKLAGNKQHGILWVLEVFCQGRCGKL